MLSLYQMVDPNFMANLTEVGGQLFFRDVARHDDLVMVVGVLSKPKGVKPEHMYKVCVQIDTDTGKDKTEQAKGSSLGGVLSQPIWGGKE